MSTKRGWVMVVLVLASILYTQYASGYAGTPYNGVVMSEPQCEDHECAGTNHYVCLCEPGKCWGETCNSDSESCDSGEFRVGAGAKGCRVYIWEEDLAPDPDDCAQAEVSRGTIFDQNYRNYAGTMVAWVALDDQNDDDAKNVFNDAHWKAESETGTYICERDPISGYHWYVCNGDTLGQTLESEGGPEGLVYICLQDSEWNYKWIDRGQIDESVDNDTDGVPDVLDCNPDDSAVHGKFGCTTKDGVETCLVNAALEICGDYKNNDCAVTDSSQGYDELTNLNYVGELGDSSDDCDRNKFACQSARAERSADGTIVAVDDGNSGCTVKGGKCSWIDAEGVGMCCGDDGNTDFGNVVTAKEGSEKYLCLNKAQVKVASGDSVGQPTVEQGWGATCTDKWCWVGAREQAAFHIFTLFKDDGETYDVVSNGENWKRCSEEGRSLSEGILDPRLLSNANSFYCYSDSGNRMSWADCRDPNFRPTPFNGIKDRGIADGPFTLPLAKHEEAFFVDFQKYEPLYGERQVNAVDYETLEFRVKFTSDLSLPAEIKLTISGPEARVEINNVLSYATTNSLLEKEKWILIRVPLDGMGEISRRGIYNQIRIDPLAPNTIDVKSLYFSRNSGVPLCSGTSTNHPTQSAWFPTADHFVAGAVILSAENLCTELYGPKAWLGDEVTEPDKRCCGNNFPGEFYNGLYGKDGCWNSQPITAGNSAALVEIGESGTNSRTHQYPCNGPECIYPLPTNPFANLGIQYWNLHPDLYDLYYVYENGTGNKVERLITSPFTPENNRPANFVVRRVSRQVLYVNNPDEQGFFGCAAQGFIAPHVTNLNFCQDKSGWYCSPSVVERNAVLTNSWTNQNLGVVGYNPARASLNPPQLKLRAETFTPDALPNLRASLPARNILPHSNLLREGEVIPYWKLLGMNGTSQSLSPGTYDAHETDTGAIITVGENQVFQSDSIPVPQNTNLFFSQSSSCTQILVRDEKENQLSRFSANASFNTGQARFLSLQFKGPNCQIYWPLLQLLDEKPSNTLYDEPVRAEDDTLATPTDFRTPLACCPANYCWNGYACIAPMNTFTTLTEPTTEDRNYRCIDGQWKDLPARSNWGASDLGFCASEQQCFVTNSPSPEGSASAFLEDPSRIPGCLNSGEFILDHYCDGGSWTSRTKFLVLNFSGVLEANDDYSLYCTRPEDALVDLAVGGSDKTTDILGNVDGCLGALPSPLTREESKCINNACVLRYKEGGEWKVAFATTLNKPFDDENSFLKVFGIEPLSPDVACPGEGNFVPCTFPHFEERVWYSRKLNALIYAREDLPLEGSLGFQLGEWLKSLFGIGGGLRDEQAFVQQARDFREVFLLKRGDTRKVRAVKEILTENRTVIVEYENFDTPVCEYANEARVPLPGFGTSVREAAEGRGKIECRVLPDRPNVQRVEAVVSTPASLYDEDPSQPLHRLWPQLTGKLRQG